MHMSPDAIVSVDYLLAFRPISAWALVVYEWQTAHHLMTGLWRVIIGLSLSVTDGHTFCGNQRAGGRLVGQCWDGMGHMGKRGGFICLSLCWPCGVPDRKHIDGWMERSCQWKAKKRKRRGWLVWWDLIIYVTPSPSSWQMCLCFIYRTGKSHINISIVFPVLCFSDLSNHTSYSKDLNCFSHCCALSLCFL